MNNQNQGKKSNWLSFIWPYLLILAIAIVAVVTLTRTSRANSLTFYSYNEFKTELTKEGTTATKLVVAEDEKVITFEGSFKRVDSNGKTTTYSFTGILPVVEDKDFVGDKAEFYEFVESETFANVYQIKNAFATSIWSTLLVSLIPTVIVVIVLFVMISRIGGANNSANNQAFNFGRSPVKNMDHTNVRFADVAGCDAEKAEMAELVDYLKNPRKYARMGARIPKGVILKGAPGTGKTLLAKAVAGEAGVPFFSISGSDFVEMFVGVGASRVRDMFKRAKANAPCMVFIDEIDAVGRQRGAGLGGGHDEREQTLNQLLVEMDGFSDNSGIIVIAATNRPDVLDPALLRPGRFDRTITVSLPDKNGREAILKVHARNKKMGADVNFENIASRTPGFSGAELENVLNEAAILAVRQNKEFIEMKDIDEAIDRVIGGPAKKGKIMTAEEKRLVAYHESGHAIVGLKLASAMKVQKITIIPRGDAGGYVMMTPTDDRFLVTKSELEERIAGLLAGRVSEEIFFKDVTSGASDDIEKATKIARMMVTNLGMSSLGPIQYEQPQGNVFLGRDYTNATRNISSEIAFQIDQEISKIMNEAIEKARKVILDNKEDLTLIAETLLVEETITYEQVVYLLEHRVLPPKENKIPEVEVNPSEEKKEENAE